MRQDRHLLRGFMRVCAALLLLASAVLASEVSSVSPMQVTLGTVVTVTGSGFQRASAGGGKLLMPKVFATREGTKKRIRFKIVSASDTVIQARVKSIPGSGKQPAAGTSWSVQIVPRGKGATGPSTGPSRITVVAPTLMSVTSSVVDVGDDVVLAIADAGDRRVRAWIGGRRMKLKRLEARDAEGDATLFTGRVRKRHRSGRWDVTVRNRLGEHALVDAVSVGTYFILNGTRYPEDKGAALEISVGSNEVRLEPTISTKVNTGANWFASRSEHVLWFPFDAQIHAPPVTFSGPGAGMQLTIWSWNSQSPMRIPMGFDGTVFEFAVDSCAAGKLVGRFEGALEGAGIPISVNGSFAIDSPDC